MILITFKKKHIQCPIISELKLQSALHVKREYNTSNSGLLADFHRRHSVVGQIIVNLLLFKCVIFSGENSFDIIDGYNEREMDTNERIISHHRRW